MDTLPIMDTPLYNHNKDSYDNKKLQVLAVIDISNFCVKTIKKNSIYFSKIKNLWKQVQIFQKSNVFKETSKSHYMLRSSRNEIIFIYT